jgi:hypothetical protein
LKRSARRRFPTTKLNPRSKRKRRSMTERNPRSRMSAKMAMLIKLQPTQTRRKRKSR